MSATDDARTKARHQEIGFLSLMNGAIGGIAAGVAVALCGLPASVALMVSLAAGIATLVCTGLLLTPMLAAGARRQGGEGR